MFASQAIFAPPLSICKLNLDSSTSILHSPRTLAKQLLHWFAFHNIHTDHACNVSQVRHILSAVWQKDNVNEVTCIQVLLCVQQKDNVD